MRIDQIKVGHVVEFRQGNTTHTGTVKSVGRNGNVEPVGTEVVIGDIFPHIYDKPTVTMHGGDLILKDGDRYPQVSNQPIGTQGRPSFTSERDE